MAVNIFIVSKQSDKNRTILSSIFGDIALYLWSILDKNDSLLSGILDDIVYLCTSINDKEVWRRTVLLSSDHRS